MSMCGTASGVMAFDVARASQRCSIGWVDEVYHPRGSKRLLLWA